MAARVKPASIKTPVTQSLFNRLLRMTVAERTRLLDLLASLDEAGWRKLRKLVKQHAGIVIRKGAKKK
jgi:hypothetical protein